MVVKGGSVFFLKPSKQRLQVRFHPSGFCLQRLQSRACPRTASLQRLQPALGRPKLRQTLNQVRVLLPTPDDGKKAADA